MIINLDTMTDNELLQCRNDVWEVYADCVNNEHQWELAGEAWEELRTLAREWGRRGHDERLFLTRWMEAAPEQETIQDVSAREAQGQ